MQEFDFLMSVSDGGGVIVQKVECDSSYAYILQTLQGFIGMFFLSHHTKKSSLYLKYK